MVVRTGARSLLPVLLLFASCAETSGGAPRPRGPRAGADDNDLWNLVPGDTDAVVDVDLAALRASPWSSALMQGDLDGDRDERRRRFGYDVFTEAERMVVAGTEVTGGPNALTIARGRFDAERVGSAFVASAWSSLFGMSNASKWASKIRSSRPSPRSAVTSSRARWR